MDQMIDKASYNVDYGEYLRDKISYLSWDNLRHSWERYFREGLRRVA